MNASVLALGSGTIICELAHVVFSSIADALHQTVVLNAELEVEQARRNPKATRRSAFRRGIKINGVALIL